jgi:2-polyprenyl-6-methoxyphenol hydroxylase-like FAD-dependent oxidoreductase
MNEYMEKTVDVVVVGAGPVGLLTAIELTLGGVRVLVLERLDTPSMVLKAGGIGPLGIEALQRRGMAAAIASAQARALTARAASAPQNGKNIFARGGKYSGHFAGLMLRRDAQKEPDRLGAPVDQQTIEAMLSDRAQALGIEVRRGCDVTEIVQREDGVDVTWASAAGEAHIRCSWLVGCDGGRSPVRKMAGFDFPGCDPTMTMYQAVVELDHPERLPSGGFHHTPGGMFMLLGNRLALFDFSGPPEDRQAPVTHEAFEIMLRRISCADVHIKSFESPSRWADNTRLVDTYRQGRVLLAGDAAHIHAPFGGQGMSLGLVDAQNLGWKLAAVICGEMSESLLDTYTAERRPVAEAVMANTLAQTAIMRPDPQSSAMRNVVANLLQLDEVNRLVGEMMSGLSTRYDLGSGRDEMGRLIGDRRIHHADADVSLYELMQDGMSVLLDASIGRTASALVAASTQKIRCVAVETGPSMLIRPDACIAWVGEENDTEGLEEALCRWFKPAPDGEATVRSVP